MRILFTCTYNFSKSWFSFVETSTRPYNFRRASSKLFYKLTETTIESNAIFSLPPLRCWEQNNRDIETQNIPFWNRRWVQPCNYAKKTSWWWWSILYDYHPGAGFVQYSHVAIKDFSRFQLYIDHMKVNLGGGEVHDRKEQDLIFTQS